MMIADFRQDGTIACDRDWLKVLALVCASLQASSFQVSPDILGLTVGGVVPVDCGCRLRWVLSVSKCAKKLLRSSSKEASGLVLPMDIKQECPKLYVHLK